MATMSRERGNLNMARTTSNLSQALLGGYIGEIPITPNELSSRIRFAFTGKGLPSWVMYFYGKRTPELNSLFGYKD